MPSIEHIQKEARYRTSKQNCRLDCIQITICQVSSIYRRRPDIGHQKKISCYRVYTYTLPYAKYRAYIKGGQVSDIRTKLPDLPCIECIHITICQVSDIRTKLPDLPGIECIHITICQVSNIYYMEEGQISNIQTKLPA